MCNKHRWVDTGMTATWCLNCDVSGDWVGDHVEIRPSNRPFPHSLEKFGIPIRYTYHEATKPFGRLSLVLSDVYVDKDWGELPAGAYTRLAIDEPAFPNGPCFVCTSSTWFDSPPSLPPSFLDWADSLVESPA